MIFGNNIDAQRWTDFIRDCWVKEIGFDNGG